MHSLQSSSETHVQVNQQTRDGSSLSRNTLVYFKSLGGWLFKRIRTLVTVHRTAGPAELSTSFLYNSFVLSTIGNIHRTSEQGHICTSSRFPATSETVTSCWQTSQDTHSSEWAFRMWKMQPIN